MSEEQKRIEELEFAVKVASGYIRALQLHQPFLFDFEVELCEGLREIQNGSTEKVRRAHNAMKRHIPPERRTHE